MHFKLFGEELLFQKLKDIYYDNKNSFNCIIEVFQEDKLQSIHVDSPSASEDSNVKLITSFARDNNLGDIFTVSGMVHFRYLTYFDNNGYLCTWGISYIPDLKSLNGDYIVFPDVNTAAIEKRDAVFLVKIDDNWYAGLSKSEWLLH